MCNKSRSFLFALLLSTLSSAQAQTYGWSQFTNSPGGTTRHDDIFMLNETTGWTARGRDGIYKTTDGGINWTKVFTNNSTHFRCIAFASATRGWAGNLGPGSYDTNVTDTTVMYETFDGGLTWSNRPGFVEVGMRGLCSLHVLDSQTIYGVGRVRGPAYFIKTTDGGTNWTIANLTAAGVMGALMDVYFKDKTNGFVVGMDTNAYTSGCPSSYHGSIARTTDGGLTWSNVVTTSVSCCYFWKMSWPTPNIGYVSLQKNPTSSDSIVFYKTTDGGNTWVSNGVPVSAFGNTEFYWQGIGFVSANEGWAGGEGSASLYPNTFLHTTDGGLTWTTNGYNNSRSINRIRVLSPTLAFASGQKLHVYRQPLAVTAQPQDQMVLGGANVTLDIQMAGNPPFNYQWRKDGFSLAGATNATLMLTNVTRSHSGSYSVGVTNAGGGLFSSNALLQVMVPQKLTPLELLAGGHVRILFGDADGGLLNASHLSIFEVQASSNLVHWTMLTNALSLTNGLILLEDLSTYSRRFYRVIEH